MLIRRCVLLVIGIAILYYFVATLGVINKAEKLQKVIQERQSRLELLMNE